MTGDEVNYVMMELEMKIVMITCKILREHMKDNRYGAFDGDPNEKCLLTDSWFALLNFYSSYL